MTEKVFNNGFLKVSKETVSYRKLLGSTHTFQRARIVSIGYQYDNLIYRVLRLPLGLLYLCTLIGIPIGIRCLRGDVIAHVEMINGERFSFWVYGNQLKEFKRAIQ